MASSTPFCYDAITTHAFTAILLHGRGSSGEEFAEDLLTLPLSKDGDTLQTRLPEWRWVFPSAPMRWSTDFQEDMAAWFESHSLTDISAKQHLQIQGIAATVACVSSLIREESRLFQEGSRRILLGGISQGAAAAVWTLLCQESNPLVGFVGTSGWLPFATDIVEFLEGPLDANRNATLPSSDDGGVWSSLRPLLAHTKSQLLHSRQSCSLLSTPVFWGHGVDDAYVNVSLGRQARDVLRGIGMKVLWKEYSGADQEGHWLKEPEEVIDIANFISATALGR